MSNEFFTIIDGKKIDVPLHNEILDGGDDLESRIATARRVIQRGMTEPQARLLYALPDDVTL